MYSTLHEADVTTFVAILDDRFQNKAGASQLKRMRTYAGLSQKALAEKSGVPLRQIQLFEQGQRDITKTQAQTLNQLACVLKCEMSTLLRK